MNFVWNCGLKDRLTTQICFASRGNVKESLTVRAPSCAKATAEDSSVVWNVLA